MLLTEMEAQKVKKVKAPWFPFTPKNAEAEAVADNIYSLLHNGKMLPGDIIPALDRRYSDPKMKGKIIALLESLNVSVPDN
jgi:hypothetical protein